VKKFKKIIALMTACLSLGLTACGAGEAVMSFRGTEITANEYRFYLATYKGNFRSSYTDFKDTDAFYTSVLTDDGMTAGEYLNDAVRHNVSMSLVCDALFDGYGLKLDRAVTDTIDSYLNDFITEYSGGSKTACCRADMPGGACSGGCAAVCEAYASAGTAGASSGAGGVPDADGPSGFACHPPDGSLPADAGAVPGRRRGGTAERREPFCPVEHAAAVAALCAVGRTDGYTGY